MRLLSGSVGGCLVVKVVSQTLAQGLKVHAPGCVFVFCEVRDMEFLRNVLFVEIDARHEGAAGDRFENLLQKSIAVFFRCQLPSNGGRNTADLRENGFAVRIDGSQLICRDDFEGNFVLDRRILVLFAWQHLTNPVDVDGDPLDAVDNLPCSHVD